MFGFLISYCLCKQNVWPWTGEIISKKIENDQHMYITESWEKEYLSLFCCESDSSHLESTAEAYFNHRPFKEDFENNGSSGFDFSSDESKKATRITILTSAMTLSYQNWEGGRFVIHKDS